MSCLLQLNRFDYFPFQEENLEGKYKKKLRWKSQSKLGNALIPWNFKFQKTIQILKPLYYKKTKNFPAEILYSFKTVHKIATHISYIRLCIYLMQNHPCILAVHLQWCLLALLKGNRVE